MSTTPQERIIDSTLLLAIEGYKLINHWCQSYQSNIFTNYDRS